MATVNIFVSLDTKANPPVVLKDSAGNSARSEKASSGDTIKWQRQDNNDNFDIDSLAPTGAGQAFATASTGGSGQWLTSVYQPTDSSPTAKFPYTLTVKDGTDSYTTTETDEDPDNGRPVIRN